MECWVFVCMSVYGKLENRMSDCVCVYMDGVGGRV